MTAKQIQPLTLDFLPSAIAAAKASFPAAYRETGNQPPTIQSPTFQPTLLMLHGFMGSGDCWQPLTALLAPHFHCVALDLLGFGESAKPSIKYDVAKEVAFVRQFIQARNLGSCYLLGHSFGGWVAVAYALAYPDAVNGLILAAPAGIRDDSFCGRYDHLRPLLWQTPVVDWVLALLNPLAKLRGQAAGIEQIRWMRKQLNSQPAARSFLVDRLRPEDAIDTVEKEIHRLRVPTLVITGDRDETIPLWHSQTYAQEIPSARLEIIPNADHSLPRDYAPQLADCLLTFLATQSAQI